jgi:hypothetical protein
MKTLPVVLLVLTVGVAHGADERARIAAERAQAQKTYDARYRECQSQFAVTACVDKARAERRATLEQLSQQQAVLDDAERKQRAAQRAQQIHEKMSQGNAPAAQRPSPELQVKAPRVSRKSSGAAPPRAAASAASAGLSDAQRAQHRADYERHQREAAEHREELERRAIDRASHQDKPVSPLPTRPAIPASAASR